MQRVAILYDASQAVLSTFDLDEVLNQVLAIVRDYFHLQSGSIMLIDEVSQRLVVRAHFGEPPPPVSDSSLAFGRGITGDAAKARRPVYSPDVTADPRTFTGVSSKGSELAIPLMVRDEVVGVLDCKSELPAFFDNEMVDLLTLFATQASIGIQNAKLYSMLQRRAAQLEAINAIAKRTTVELDLKELLDRLCNQLPQSFQIEHVAIFLRDEDGDLVLRAQQGTLTTGLKVNEALPHGYPCTVSGDGHNKHCGDPLCPSSGFAGHEEICLPLVSFGENLGLLVCVATPSNAFVANDIQALESVADIVATATQNARYVDRIRQLAYRDGLTGVFNRRYFDSRLIDEVIRASRYGGGVSVLMIDLDHFKKINDDFGHMLGDDVLRAVSAVFVRQLRKVDVVCRYGGEEFAVVLPTTQGASAAAVAEKLRCAIANTTFAGVPYPVTVSIGVAEFPAHGITRDDIIRAADAALYNAKERGRNLVCLALAASATVAKDETPSSEV